LSPTENDDYATCAGDALRKCISVDVISLEHRVGTVEEDTKFVECFEDQVKNCTEPMIQHLKGWAKAYKKHVREMSRELETPISR